MRHVIRRRFGNTGQVSARVISRRSALGAAAVTALGALSGSALGRERSSEGRPGMTERMRQLMEETQAYTERMRDAGPEERRQIMRERMAARNQHAIANLKEQLGCSDTEWQVVKPRVEAVYNLVHPLPQVGGGADSSRSEVDHKMQELHEVLADKGADVERIRAGLTAVRAAKERANQRLAGARQSLRQLMTVRQEATLVVNGLLD